MSNEEQQQNASGSGSLQLQQLAVQQQHLQQQQMQLHVFWQNQIQDIQRIIPEEEDFKTHQLPLARIKKIMKSDEDVRMISAEAPVLFAKACEMFILELTLRSWIHTEENKRRTLQRNDIAMAITKTDIFDFLIDIVPRDDIKPAKKMQMPAEQAYMYLQHQNQPGQGGQAAAAGAMNGMMDPQQQLAYQQQLQQQQAMMHQYMQQQGQNPSNWQQQQQQMMQYQQQQMMQMGENGQSGHQMQVNPNVQQMLGQRATVDV